MAAPYQLSSSSVFPTTPEVAYAGILAAPLEELFPERSGAIPAVRECTGQVGDWATVGQSRTVVLADGSSNLETLVGLDAPGEYRYRLTDFTGPMKLLVASVDGRFGFVPEGTGTRATWSWQIHPTNAVTRLAMPLLGVFWRKYAAGMWPRYAARLTT